MNNNRFLKRINKDVENAINVQVIPINQITTTTIIEAETKETKTTVEINNNIKIIFGKDYPFTKFEVIYNDNPYYSFLKTTNPKIVNLLIKLKYGCLCCTTMFCDWRLTHTINDFLAELKLFKRIKTEIKYIIMINNLQKKYEKIPMQLILEYLLL